MILRSEFNKVKENPSILRLPSDKDVKFYLNEKEAYLNCPANHRSVVAQWDMILDDATDDELQTRKKEIEDRIKSIEQSELKKYGEIYLNEAQKELMRSLYNHQHIYSCWYLSDEEASENWQKAARLSLLDGDDDDDF